MQMLTIVGMMICVVSIDAPRSNLIYNKNFCITQLNNKLNSNKLFALITAKQPIGFMSIDPNTQAPAEVVANSADENNLAQMRKLIGQERKARVAAEERAQQLEQQSKSKPTYREEEEDESEPYVDHRKLNKKFAQFEETFEKKVDAMAEQKARQLYEIEKQKSFLRNNPDFDAVLSPEVIKKFADKHPDQAEDMLELPDNFARQKLLYNKIKDLGLHKPQQAGPSIQETIDKNRKSPYYQPSGGNTPPYASQGDFSKSGQANAYTKMKELIANRRG